MKLNVWCRFGGIVGSSVVLSACGPSERESVDVVRPIAWAYAEAAPDAVPSWLPGTVRKKDRSPLAFEVGGKVAEIRKKVGDHFTTGDVLAVLDQTSFLLRVEERKAYLADARAQEQEASRNLERALQLQTAGVLSKQEFDRARQAAESGMSRVGSAAAALALAKKELADTELRAPYDGEVVTRSVELAQQVRAGESAFEIQSNDSGFEVVALVPQSLAEHITRDSSYPVRLLNGRGGEQSARVKEIQPRLEAGNAVAVTLHLAREAKWLSAGMTVEVGFLQPTERPEQGLVSVPVTALLAAEANTFQCFVYNPETQAVDLRDVRLVELVNSSALVAGGLRPGEIVASKGVAFLQDGQQVALLGKGLARYNP